MKKITKILCLMLCLLLCFATFAACDAGAPGATGEQGAQGEKGDTPTIEISDDGYWVINGEKTNIKAEASTSEDGADGLEYYPLPDGTYGVSAGTTKYLEEIIIPKTHKEKPVTTIVYYAFDTAKNLKSITIPDSVTSIGFYAFRSCSSLTSITIPDSVTSIGEGAFCDCSSLTSITIPDSVTSIGFYAFNFCDSLTDIYFTGTEEEWGAISESGAYIPSSATIHCNYVPSES